MSEQQRIDAAIEIAVRYGGMTDRAEDIAREIALRHIPSIDSEYPLSAHSRAIVVGNLQDAIAAALRSYLDEGLEDAATMISEKLIDPYTANRIRALKSESKEATDAR